MEEGLKQRLVGALVLLMLAIIFLPLILDGRDEDHDAVVYRAPQEPVIQITHKGSDQVEKRLEKAKAQFVVDRTPKPEDEGDVANSSDVEPAVVASKQAPEVKQKAVSAEQQSNIDQTRAQFVKELAENKAVKETPVQSKMALADAWTVQVAAFSKLENAKGLQSKLISKSYMAYIISNEDKSKPLYRVYVGPELRKNRARIIQQALKKEFKLAGMIKSYNP